MTVNRNFCVAVALCSAVGSAALAAGDTGRSGAPPSGALAPRAVANAPMKGELRVSPGDLRLVAVQTNIDALTKDFNKLAGDAKAFEAMAKSIPEMVKQCSAKAYSVQDQAAAGCTAGDTVAQCSDKLLKHCLANLKATSLPGGISLPGGSVAGVPMTNPSGAGSGAGKIGFSIQEFQQKAGATAAEARALSQLLSAYASQVESSAKKVTP